MNEKEYIWLTRNTTIDNQCEKFKDCYYEKVVFKLFRKHHLAEIKKIFADHEVQAYKDGKDYAYLEVKDLTIADFCKTAMDYNSDIIYNDPTGRCYYDPANRKIYEHILRLSTPQQLSQLSPRKKLDILMSIDKDCYFSLRHKQKHEYALERKAEKINALLQFPISPEFWEREQRKVRLIAAEIARMRNIKKRLENFQTLEDKEQKKLFARICKITAKYNGIKAPTIQYLGEEEIKNYIKNASDDEEMNVEGFASEKTVFVNNDSFKKLSGAQVLSVAWHETNHIAMSHGDYSQFPLMEDILNPRLDYINGLKECYILHPQEKINYALEKQFIEEVVNRTGIKADDKTMEIYSEYAVAMQYMAKALQKNGR